MLRLILNYSLIFSSLLIFVSLFFSKMSYWGLSEKKEIIQLLNQDLKEINMNIEDIENFIKLYNENNLDFKESLIKKELFLKSENEKVIFY